MEDSMIECQYCGRKFYGPSLILPRHYIEWNDGITLCQGSSEIPIDSRSTPRIQTTLTVNSDMPETELMRQYLANEISYDTLKTKLFAIYTEQQTVRQAQLAQQAADQAKARERARQENAHAREYEGVCPGCGGRTINGRCLLQC